MRATLRAWRSVSSPPMLIVQSRPNSAAAVAVATPCWPAPVSAITRVFPIRRVSSAWPSTLLILWLPVWLRSSRLSRIRAPPASCEKRGASESSEGRPVYSAASCRSSAVNSGSTIAFSYTSISSSSAGTSASGRKRPRSRRSTGRSRSAARRWGARGRGAPPARDRARGRGCSCLASFRDGAGAAGHPTVRPGGVARGDQRLADQDGVGAGRGVGLDVGDREHGGLADRERAGGDHGQQVRSTVEVDAEVLEVAGVDADELGPQGERAFELGSG